MATAITSGYLFSNSGQVCAIAFAAQIGRVYLCESRQLAGLFACGHGLHVLVLEADRRPASA